MQADPYTYDLCADSFDEMGLTDEVIRGVYCYGLEKPSAVQSKAIPAIMRCASLSLADQVVAEMFWCRHSLVQASQLPLWWDA